MAQNYKDKIPTEKPVKPGYDECCAGGCPDCVWNVYYDQLAKWRELQGLPSEGNSLLEDD